MHNRNYSAQGVQVGDHGSFRQGDVFHGPVTFSGADGVSRLPIAHAAAFNSLVETRAARCHPETRVALLQDITTWAAAPTGRNIFWLQGMAGTGKSTISRTVCESFSRRNELGASFFFKRDEHDRNDASRFFATLAAQLATLDASLRASISMALDADITIIGRALRDQFQTLILEPIEARTADSVLPKTMLLVIDALDECEHEADIKAIISLLIEANKARNVLLKIFITSRPELPIRLGFNQIKGAYDNCVLQDVPIDIIEHDIAMFLGSELAKIRLDYNSLVEEDRQLATSWPGPEVAQQLRQKCVPLFILAATICRFIGDSTYSDPPDLLTKVLQHWSTQGSQNDQLDDTYRPVLDQLLAGASNNMQIQVLSEFRQVVGPIVLLEEPLPVDALVHLLEIPTRVVERRLMSLHSVLQVPTSKDMRIRMLHLSFRDYLVDVEKWASNPFWIDEEKTHQELATQCIRLLGSNHNLRKNICNLQDSCMHRAKVPLDEIYKSIPAEVRYACLYWTHHLERSKAQLSDDHFCFPFLKTHFLHWLEALSLLGRMTESISLINKLRSLIEVNNEVVHSTNISAFLYDAYRFSLNCRSLIDETPLQLYTSALVFAPHRSIIRNITTNKRPHWVRCLTMTELEWGSCLQTLKGHTAAIHSIAFTPDSKTLASGSRDRTIRIWDVATGVHQYTITYAKTFVNILVFSPDGKTLAAALGDGKVQFWDTATWALQLTLEGGVREPEMQMSFSSDGSTLFLCDSFNSDHRDRYWDLTSGDVYPQAFQKQGDMHPITLDWGLPFHHENGYVHTSKLDLLASGSDDGTICIWTTRSLSKPVLQKYTYGKVYRCINDFFADKSLGHKFQVEEVVISPDGQWIASLSTDNEVRIWRMADPSSSRLLSGSYEFFSGLAFSPNGRFLLYTSKLQSDVNVWDCVTGDRLYESYQGFHHWNHRACLALSPDSKIFAVYNGKNTVSLYNTQSGLEMQSFTLPSLPMLGIIYVTVMEFSPMGTTLTIASPPQLLFWDVRASVMIRTNETYELPFEVVTFSPNEESVAAGSSDGTIHIIAAATGLWQFSLEAPSKQTTIAISPDNVTMASCGYDCTIRLWNLSTRSCDTILKLSLMVRQLSFIDEGSRLQTERGTLTVHPGTSDPSAGPDLDYDIFAEQEWLYYQGRRVLQLPPDYRANCAAMHGNQLAIGRNSGEVTVLRFDFSQCDTF